MSRIVFLGREKRILDVTEQVALSAFYIWFIFRLCPGKLAEAHSSLMLLILSESLVFVLVLIRRPAENISSSLSDWSIAFCGTLLPLLVDKGGEPWMPNLGAALLLCGFVIHVGAKISLSRASRIVPANRGVKMRGLYAFVRHPMYVGYFLTHVGFLVTSASLFNLVVYSCCWGCQLSRIFSEERMLLASIDYQYYKKEFPTASFHLSFDSLPARRSTRSMSERKIRAQ